MCCSIRVSAWLVARRVANWALSSQRVSKQNRPTTKATSNKKKTKKRTRKNNNNNNNSNYWMMILASSQDTRVSNKQRGRKQCAYVMDSRNYMQLDGTWAAIKAWMHWIEWLLPVNGSRLFMRSFICLVVCLFVCLFVGRFSAVLNETNSNLLAARARARNAKRICQISFSQETAINSIPAEWNKPNGRLEQSAATMYLCIYVCVCLHCKWCFTR